MTVLDDRQREAIRRLLLYRLSQPGSTISELGTPHPGDPEQLPHQHDQVWHTKSGLDEWLAAELRLAPSLWGPDAKSVEFTKFTSGVLAKLRSKKTMLDWSSSKRTNIYRLANPNPQIQKPTMTSSEPPKQPATETLDMSTTFLRIVYRASKDNTYKFVLGKTLLDYCKKKQPDGKVHEIPYDYLAEEFLKHYWYQKYRFRMKQSFHTKKRPVIMQILEKEFGENPPFKFEDQDPKAMARAKEAIRKNVFGPAIKKKGMVVQRFQRIKNGNIVQDNDVFYDYDDAAEKIFLKPEAHSFLRQNNRLLSGALLSQWVKYLERTNYGLPMLTSKLDDEEAERGPLTKYKQAFYTYEKECFYCNGKLDYTDTHVDHFIPWSYIFDDDAWNLVLACPSCNIKKHNSLPKEDLVNELISRDQGHQDRLKLMHDSLLRLSFKGPWENEIKNHYKICSEYDFGMWTGNP